MTRDGLQDLLLMAGLGLTVVVVVVALRLFFDLRAALLRRGMRTRQLPLGGLDSNTVLRVCLKDGRCLDGLRPLGVLDEARGRAAGLPPAILNFVCFARTDGSRVWIDSQAIRVIEAMPVFAAGREDA